jgi:hypothetical protein
MSADAEAQLESFFERFDTKNQKLFRSARSALRKRFPTANELAYDYADSVVISYTPTEHGKDGIVTIALRADGVRLYLSGGPKLPDPKKLLQGSAGIVRYVPLEAAGDLDHPDVKALVAAALAQAKVPYSSKGKGTLTIRPTTAAKRKSPRPKR